jgi:hypothetical protein
VPALAETADEVEALVGGDAAADDQENATGHDGVALEGLRNGNIAQLAGA